MSISHLSAVYGLPEPTGAPRAVLLVLAEHANASTGECWPSETRIAARAGLHEGTVRRAVKALESAGLIVVQRTPGRVNRYLLLVEPVARLADPARNARGGRQKPRALGTDTPRTKYGDPAHDARRTVNNPNEPPGSVADGIAAARAALQTKTA